MGAAALPVAGITSIASLGLSAYGTYQKGKGVAAAAEYKAETLDRAAQYGELQAAETGAAHRQKLARSLGMIDAVRAAANTDPTSPTGAAVRDYSETQGETSRIIAQQSFLQQAEQERTDAAFTRAQGKYAMGLTDLDVAATLLKGVGGTNFSNFGIGTS
jgi:hypothetical protein